MINLQNILKEACWKGYKQIGMKDKDGRKVPNCVPVDESEIVREEDNKEFAKYLREICIPENIRL